MLYRIEYKPKVVKFLESISKDDRDKIQKRIADLSTNPRNDHVIKLFNMKPEHYRARQGNYRIFFTIHDKHLIVEVIDIKNRQNAYKK